MKVFKLTSRRGFFHATLFRTAEQAMEYGNTMAAREYGQKYLGKEWHNYYGSWERAIVATDAYNGEYTDELKAECIVVVGESPVAALLLEIVGYLEALADQDRDEMAEEFAEKLLGAVNEEGL